MCVTVSPFSDEKEKTADASNRKRRASLPETGHGKAPEVVAKPEVTTSNPGACDDSDETSSTATSEQKRKRRVSEEPSTSTAKSVTIVSLPASLSVTPALSASLAKHRGQDDRVKISEMYATLKRTVTLLIQLCEGGIKPEVMPQPDAGKSDAESGKRDGSRDKPESKDSDVDKKDSDAK